ncbi:MAG: integrase arm-type DNA-binding domain-containing protein [Hyphomonadaceae bacterium]|nr:integrase arm-type DNA-binding domain-containing protein [Hyphomonadaceae bacterium]
MANVADSAEAGVGEDKSRRAPPLRAELNDGFIKRLRLPRPPLGYDSKGKLAFATEDDPLSKSYILWDSSRDSPPGFGVKVAGKKTYILRRKVHGKSILAKIGNVADFDDIAKARKRAAQMALQMLDTGRNPNEIARQRIAGELTLGDAMGDYRQHLVERSRPASDETLRVYDRAAARMKALGWAGRRVVELTPEEIDAKFGIDKDRVPSSNEQNFRWASRAVTWCIDREKLAAQVQRREATLAANPFDTLVQHGRYRDALTLEKQRRAKGVRNPLSRTETLGKFLEATWSKKDVNDNCTGAHYLLLMLLWGCRKSEHADLVWGELLDPIGDEGEGRTATSHVWLSGNGDQEGPYVFFYKTKNFLSHKLPITPFALELLRQRQRAAAKEAERRGFGAKSRKFVFPARSRSSNLGHYKDASDLLDDIREEIEVQKLTRHDLRRTFGRIAEHVGVPEGIIRYFLNHSDTTVTDRYTDAEWADLRMWMQKVEQEMLSKGPNVYNDLKPVDWPMMPAPPRHACRPPKPRTGRPRKAEAQEPTSVETELS